MRVKGVLNFCFCQLSMQILWRRRVVDLKLPIVRIKVKSWPARLTQFYRPEKETGDQMPTIESRG